jgi:hypothetical protein
MQGYYGLLTFGLGGYSFLRPETLYHSASFLITSEVTFVPRQTESLQLTLD